MHQTGCQSRGRRRRGCARIALRASRAGDGLCERCRTATAGLARSRCRRDDIAPVEAAAELTPQRRLPQLAASRREAPAVVLALLMPRCAGAVKRDSHPELQRTRRPPPPHGHRDAIASTRAIGAKRPEPFRGAPFCHVATQPSMGIRTRIGAAAVVKAPAGRRAEAGSNATAYPPRWRLGTSCATVATARRAREAHRIAPTRVFLGSVRTRIQFPVAPRSTPWSTQTHPRQSVQRPWWSCHA